MDLTRIPVARELFTQWKRARGTRVATGMRPFGRDWEKLLADAGLHSGLEQEEAMRDAEALAAGGWLQVQPVKYHVHRIARVFIPLDQEERWKQAFGYVLAGNEEAERFRGWQWEPELGWCSAARLLVPFEDVRRIDAFLKSGGRHRVPVPIKERSLDIFGDEKRLDELYRGSTLFESGRLTREALRFYVVPEPLPWVRGPDRAQPLLVLENVATWDSYRRWNKRHGRFGAVVYGGGDRFREGALYLREIFAELGGPRDVFYFGDLDGAGLRIPRHASDRAQGAGLPAVQPHLWSYRELLRHSPDGPADEDLPDADLDRDCAWLGELAEPARSLLRSGQRLAQEHLGWEFLRDRDPA
jgi:hypothetical protein